MSSKHKFCISCLSLMHSLVVAFLIFSCTSCTVASSLSDFAEKIMNEREEWVRKLAVDASELFNNRTNEVEKCQCSTHACTSEPISDTCNYNLGTNTWVCGADCKGQYLNYDKSFVMTPPGTDPKNLSAEIKESICTYQTLEEKFRERRSDIYTWTYIGTTDGQFRVYPGHGRNRNDTTQHQLDDCRKYDPRLRPWFIAASTGPKDIVFVLDKSKSMSDNKGDPNVLSKWDAAKKAVGTIIDGLSTGDFMNVVLFSDEAKPLWEQTKLAAATNDNKQRLREILEAESTDGGVYFDEGFKLAFELLKDACIDESKVCSGCEKVIIFLTGNRDNSKPKLYGERIKPSEMNSNIEGYQKTLEKATGRRASIFTFSLGEDADDAIPRQIACNNRGSWSFIHKAEDPLTAMRNYYLFLAMRRYWQDPNSEEAKKSTVWTEPYEDDFGYGSITSVAVPIYSKPTGNVDGVCLGVLAHDYLLSDFGDSKEEVIRDIARRATSCVDREISQCTLQVLRNVYANNASCIDRFPVGSEGSDDVEDPPCFTSSGPYYKRFSEEVTWERAKELCQKDNGSLVSITDEGDLSFVANLAADDGTWIGARNISGKFSWEDGGNSDMLKAGSSFWGIGQPDRGGNKDCVSIDTRGPTGNLDTRDCDIRLAYICEYENDENCRGGIRDPREEPKDYFTTPPLDLCISRDNSLAQLQPTEEATSLDPLSALCPLGNSRPDVERVCCDRCLPPVISRDYEKSGDLSLRETVFLFLLCLFAVIALILAITLCKRASSSNSEDEQI